MFARTAADNIWVGGRRVNPNRVQTCVFRSPFAQFPNVHLHCSQMSVWTFLKFKCAPKVHLARSCAWTWNNSKRFEYIETIWNYSCACFVVHGTSNTSKKREITAPYHDLQCGDQGFKPARNLPGTCSGPARLRLAGPRKNTRLGTVHPGLIPSIRI